MVRPRANQHEQISCGQMFVPQSKQSRHNIRRKRNVPKNVRSFTTQPHQIEAAVSILEGRNALDPSVRIREHELRGDSFLPTQTRLEIKETRRLSSEGVAVGATPFDSVHKKTDDHRQKQCRIRTVCSSIGSIRSERR